ncbi:tRNA (guanosine(46)-N(7))-methyltransferase TrmB [Parvularcula sp. IMCC14364]|uniref:tRNA (guanine(46)-N(7))-methyltransferase TrmB n=1 Tax=Parvularcula sp. IMCC14364 TaxID=3067902 RepID=UPI00274247BE|nr:hypothetical protein [Parvularcula sp. IMCC14364]
MTDVQQYYSRDVISNQDGLHDRLSEVVQRHLSSPYLAPISDHNYRAFEEATTVSQRHQKPLILDSGCGTGDSSRKLASSFPDHLILGIDKSADRLGRRRDGLEPENLLLLRADLVDFYRLAADAGWQLARHYISYPNPWPKAAHFQRRWHGSPVFPSTLKLTGKLELRTNWRIYAQEFSAALTLAGQASSIVKYDPQGDYLSLFEKKYAESGQSLWQVTALLSSVDPVPGKV